MESNDTKFEPKGEDKIREEIIAALDLDPESDENESIIDKLVTRELEHQKTLGKAIEQKQTYRQRLEDVLNEEKPEVPKGEVDKKDETQIDTSKFVTKEDLQRMKYPNLSDEEYSSINALAKSSGKGFEETIESNPLAKTYFESSEQRGRLESVQKNPSTRSTVVENKSEDDKIADDLDSNLPTGFTSKKE